MEAPLGLGQPFVHGDQVLVGRADPVSAPGASHAIAPVALDAATGGVLGEDARGAVRAIRGDRALLADGSWRDLGLWVWFNDLAVVDLSTGPSRTAPGSMAEILARPSAWT